VGERCYFRRLTVSAVALVGIAAGAARAEDTASTAVSGSLSCGSVNRGALTGGRAIADRGPGFLAPEPWRERGLRFGTDELVTAIERAAAAVARRHPGALLAVADLSAERGGPVPRHRSHQSGRDVDLVYYAIDRAGEPMAPDGHMPLFEVDGRAVSADSPERAPQIAERYFDLSRNWALVEALATDPDVRVTRIFVSRRVRDWLLAYAAAARISEPVRARVQQVLAFPADVRGHDDHMHVRIGCSADDVAAGACSEAAAPRRRRGKWTRAVPCGESRIPVAAR
jgi:penicillin-insensitive murein endopeptidase